MCDDCLAPNVNDAEKGCDNMTVIIIVFRKAYERIRMPGWNVMIMHRKKLNSI